MLNFYRRFLPNAIEPQSVLQDLIDGNRKRDTRPVIWTLEADQAFERCKQLLVNATTLAHPKADAPVTLHTDASLVAIGGVVSQLVNGDLQPLGFFSKKLSDSERNYDTFDRELLAIYRFIRYFKHFLEGRLFVCYTDHKPLVTAPFKSQDDAHDTRKRRLDFVCQHTTDIRHVSGSDNVVADCLSRICSVTTQVLDYDLLAMEQENDPELADLLCGRH